MYNLNLSECIFNLRVKRFLSLRQLMFQTLITTLSAIFFLFLLYLGFLCLHFCYVHALLFHFGVAKCMKVSSSKMSLWTFNFIAYELFSNKIVEFCYLDCDNNLEYSTCKIWATMRFDLTFFLKFFSISFPNILNLQN
jgi:hypothetical protein